MSFPRWPAAAGLVLAGLLGAGPAAAYVRQADSDTGACLYWKPRSVTYRINPTRAGTSPTCGALSATDSGAADAVRAGFAAWTGAREACTDLQLLEGPTTSEQRIGYDQGGSNENLVVFRKGWCSENDAAKADPCWTDRTVRCSDTYGCFENSGSLGGTNIIALTTTTYAPSSGEIVDADMEFIDWTGAGEGTVMASTRLQGWYFTCFDPGAEPTCSTYGQADCHSMDLENTATHEAGHFVGLAHSPEAGATMEATAGIGEISKRSLETDDVSGLCFIYPKAAATAVCVTTSKDRSGCASAGGAGVLSLLALLALRRRPRHRTTTPA